MRLRAKAQAISGTQQEQQLASHSPVSVFGVIQRAGRLQIEDQHRGAGPLNGGQNLAARGIGADVANDQLHSFAGEEVARGGGGRGRIHQPGVNHVAELVQVAADDALVAFQPALQALELRPVSRQANAEQPDFSSLGLGFQTTSR